MFRTLSRILFFLFVIAGCLRLSAQDGRSDIAVWTVGSFIADQTLTDIEGGSLDIGFDEQGPGFGLSVNHFWTDQFSTELSVMTFGAEMHATPWFAEEFEIGELEGRAVTAMAQWHFRQAMRVQPYLAAGVAHIGGTFDPVDDEPEDGEGPIDLESDVTWSAAAGLTINFTDRVALTFEAKRIPWETVEEGGLDEEAIDVTPMLYGTGLRFRF